MITRLELIGCVAFVAVALVSDVFADSLEVKLTRGAVVYLTDGAMELQPPGERHAIENAIYYDSSLLSLFTILEVDSVEYLFPDALTKSGMWGGALPSGEPIPNYDNDFVLLFQTESARDAALSSLDTLAGDSLCAVVVAEACTELEFFETTVFPNDPYYQTEQWALKSGSGGIRANQAWEITTGDERVTLAVVDRGYFSGHDDLGLPRMGGDVNLYEGHGTRVSGVIGALTNQQSPTGIAAVDWYSTVLVKNAGADPAQNAADEILEVVNEGARAINCSWGDEIDGNGLSVLVR